MTQSGILGVFADHAFLKDLGDRHLMRLATAARPVSFAAGDTLFKEGDTARAFYLVKAGTVALGTKGPGGKFVETQTVGAGEALGWSWIVAPYRWRFEAQAKTAVQTVAFDAEWLRQECETDHELGYQLLKHLITTIADRLSATRLRLTRGPEANGK